MPQIYTHSESERRGSGSSGAGSPSAEPRAVDADDSIVLSDLVRTGEASRLRRRGAMRIDHSHSSSSSSSSTTTTVPNNIVLVERSNWDSDSDFEEPLARRRHTRFGGRRHSTKDEYSYSVVCGAEMADSFDDDYEPFMPSVLPLYPPSASSSGSRTKWRQKKSTGCGAAVHLHVSPLTKQRTWAADSGAADSVVRLDDAYFDAKDAAKLGLGTSPCGCVKEGVGCALCGNTLGIRHVPCKDASDGHYCPRIPDKFQLTRLKPKQALYTFFADAVTSTPDYSFPSTSSSTPSPIVSPRFAPVTLPPEHFVYPHEEPYESEGEMALAAALARRGTAGEDDDDPIETYPYPYPAAESDFTRWAPISEWGQSQPQPQPQPQPRTRNGRTARRSSIGRFYPSLSSGLSVGTAVVSPISANATPTRTRPRSTTAEPSFYQQQILTAWERERERERELARERERAVVSMEIEDAMEDAMRNHPGPASASASERDRAGHELADMWYAADGPSFLTLGASSRSPAAAATTYDADGNLVDANGDAVLIPSTTPAASTRSASRPWTFSSPSSTQHQVDRTAWSSWTPTWPPPWYTPLSPISTTSSSSSSSSSGANPNAHANGNGNANANGNGNGNGTSATTWGTAHANANLRPLSALAASTAWSRAPWSTSGASASMSGNGDRNGAGGGGGGGGGGIRNANANANTTPNANANVNANASASASAELEYKPNEGVSSGLGFVNR